MTHSTTQWLIGAAVLVVGAVMAGFAMFGIGLTLLWSGFGTPDSDRPWWLFPLLVAPPVLMVGAGLLVRRLGGAAPVALSGAGAVGVVIGVTYLITVWLTN